MQMKFCPLYSGSSGNCTYIATEKTRLLVDAGMSGKMLSDALNAIHVLPETVDAILITHEHSDHVKGAGILSRKYHIPIYANAATWRAMERQVGAVPQALRRVFETGESFFVGEMDVLPFSIPHDAADPVGFRVFAGGHSVATATDMGYLTQNTVDAIGGSDVVLLESNHDPDMLMQNPHYSARLKQRILGRHGHLSNESCAQAVLTLYETGVRHLVLGHLSGENNTPSLALETTLRAVEKYGLAQGEDIFIHIAWRDRVSGMFTVG
ncbi:MAG: MBL fold metallo-hydrolase [Clostridiales bacterium]|nr:MBL fold metallo-hydrolase [Clostridiales bacterium]